MIESLALIAATGVLSGSPQPQHPVLSTSPPPRVLSKFGRLAVALRCPRTPPASFFFDIERARTHFRALCVQSVVQAPSDRAARAVVYAFRAVGSRYSQADRGGLGVYDCSSLVSRAWFAAGVSAMRQGGSNSPYWPTTYTLLDGAGGTYRVSGPGRPGDLVFPHSGHVMMRISQGMVIHASSPATGVRVSAGSGSVVMRVR